MKESFVKEALGLEFVHDDDAPLGVHHLVGLSVRRNPKRAHLLVSTVLGKHIPQDPRIMVRATDILGSMASYTFTSTVEEARAFHAPQLAELRRVIEGEISASELSEFMPYLQHLPHVAIGFAETATAMGFMVSRAMRSHEYLHSTRFYSTGDAVYGGFEESHSHATSHQLVPRRPETYSQPWPIVLIDDELSTGKTAINTIRELHAIAPHDTYIIATFIDCRTAPQREAMHDFAQELGIRVEVVSLAAGEIEVPSDAVEKASEIIRDKAQAVSVAEVRVDPSRLDIDFIRVKDYEQGRYGVQPNSPAFGEASRMIGEVVNRYPHRGGSILFLGIEESMALPLDAGLRLAHQGRDIRFGSTTQSPVAVVNEDGYAIRNAVYFLAGRDELAQRFSYNILSTEWDRIVLVVEPDDHVDDVMVPNGIIAQLHALTGAEISLIAMER